MEENITRFESLCKKSGIEYRVHKDPYDFTLQELKDETRFADVLVLGSESFYKDLNESAAFDYLKTALHQVECPVVIVPENFEFPEINILSYDGSKSSSYAIKQFSYIFPVLADHPSILVYADKSAGKGIPEEEKIEELVARHYKDLQITPVTLNPQRNFKSWLEDSKSPILVSGSFGRSSFSQIFKHSFVSDIIKENRIPVFIAHK